MITMMTDLDGDTTQHYGAPIIGKFPMKSISTEGGARVEMLLRPDVSADPLSLEVRWRRAERTGVCRNIDR